MLKRTMKTTIMATALCRTCLSSDTQRPMVPLASGVPHLPGTSHLDCLRNCTQLDVSLCTGNDKLKYPEQICLRCSKALLVSYHFLNLVRDSESTLRSQQMTQVQFTKAVNKISNLEFMPDESQLNTWPISNERNPHSQACTFYDHGQLQQTNIGDLTVASKPTDTCSEDVNNFTEIMVINENVGTNDLIIEDHETNEVDPNNEVVMDFSDTSTIEVPTDDSRMQRKQETIDGYDHNSETTLNIPQNEAADFFEVIKENLTDGASDLALVRNEFKQLKCTRELQKAFDDKEAEVNNNNELVCTICDERFSDMHIFIRHKNRHKGITPFRCSACNYFTCYSESLRKHYKKEHKIVATNDMLNRTIDSKAVPMENLYHEITYKCIDCTFKTFKDEDIIAHLTNEHQITEELDRYIQKAYNCTDCHRVFNNLKGLRTHFTLMHGVSMGIKKLSTETYACEHCDKQFQFKSSITAHQRVCQLREPMNCNICNKKFVTVRKFEHHVRDEHAVETIHECEVCGKTFTKPSALSLHRKRHTERHFQCEFCSCNYINSTELRVHRERIHNSSNQVKALCRICGATFTQIDLLRQHERRDHCQNHFKCIYCEYSSSSRCKVRWHEFIHTGKPYKCELCGKDYALRADMRRHAHNVHSIKITEHELSVMFRKKCGYPSRYDAFSTANNSLEISEVSEEQIELELQELGLKFEDIVKDLFQSEEVAEQNSSIQTKNKKH